VQGKTLRRVSYCVHGRWSSGANPAPALDIQRVEKMNIVIALQKELDSKLILDFVSNYKWPAKSKFKVVHVLHPHECTSTTKREYLERFLNSFVQNVKKNTGSDDVSSVVDEGEPVGAVLRVSEYAKADMVIMGHDPAHAENHKSVSESLAQLEKCSIVIIRPPFHTGGGAKAKDTAKEEAIV